MYICVYIYTCIGYFVLRNFSERFRSAPFLYTYSYNHMHILFGTCISILRIICFVRLSYCSSSFSASCSTPFVLLSETVFSILVSCLLLSYARCLTTASRNASRVWCLLRRLDKARRPSTHKRDKLITEINIHNLYKTHKKRVWCLLIKPFDKEIGTSDLGTCIWTLRYARFLFYASELLRLS